jgi:hypothetical protein
MQACDLWVGGKYFHDFEARRAELSSTLDGGLGNMFCAFIWLNITLHDDAIDIVLKWRTRHATQPQDKIFGLLGLLGPDKMKFCRSCDYSTPVAEVFCCLTLDLILEYWELFPLMADSRFDFPPELPNDVPSWAWDARNTNGLLDLFFKQYSYRKYNAAAGQDIDYQAMVDRGEHTRMTLELKGVKIDTVEFVGQASYILSHPNEVPTDFCAENMRAWYELAKSVLGEEGSFTTPPCSEVSSESSSRTPSPELLPQSPPSPTIPSMPPSPTLSASALPTASAPSPASTPPSPTTSSSSTPPPLPSTLYCGSYSHREAFGRLMLGDFIRLDCNSQEFRPVDVDEDVDKVYELMNPEQCECGEEHYPYDFIDTLRNITSNQRFFITKKGLMGLGHRNVEVGDEVWVFDGGKVPFLVRPREIQEKEEDDAREKSGAEDEEGTGEKEETGEQEQIGENKNSGEEQIGEIEQATEEKAVEEEPVEKKAAKEESIEGEPTVEKSEEGSAEDSGEEESEWEECSSDDDDDDDNNTENEALALDYDFVGSCIVQGIMQGEAFDMKDQLGELEEQTVHLH